MAPTMQGPTAALHLATPDDEHTTLVLDAPYRELPALRSAVEGVRAFLEQPMVPGIAPLTAWDAEAGRLTWRTGPCLPLAQLLAAHPRGLGARAACELGWLASQVLADAADAGASQGVFAHGDVSPWTLAVSPWGELVLLAYGLPEPEWQRLRRTGGDAPRVASLAWAPPERLAGRPEDAASDGFSLALVVAAALLGPSLYDTDDPASALADARAGDAAARLGRKRSGPGDVREHLAGMLARSPTHRPDPRAWADGWAPLLAGHDEGATLADLARDTAEAPPAEASAPRGGVRATRSYSLDHLRALARRLESLPPEDDATDETPPPGESAKAPSKKAVKAPPAPPKATGEASPKKATRAPPAPQSESTKASPKKTPPPPPKAPSKKTVAPSSRKATKAPPAPSGSPTLPPGAPAKGAPKPSRKAAAAPPPPTAAPAEPAPTGDAAPARPRRRDD